MSYRHLSLDEASAKADNVSGNFRQGFLFGIRLCAILCHQLLQPAPTRSFRFLIRVRWSGEPDPSIYRCR